MTDRQGDAEWLEWSGLPAALNDLRSNGWLVFKKLVEMDCRAGRRPGVVEVSVTELAERCGLPAETAAKVIETLRKKKYLRAFLPEHPDEESLIEIIIPVKTPLAPDEVARRAADPLLRDPTQFRYATAPEEAAADMEKVQAVVDLYLNKMSQKMNTFILEQIEVTARRFAMEDIQRTIERAARHEIRQMGWVLKELIREQGKRKKKPAT